VLASYTALNQVIPVNRIRDTWHSGSGSNSVEDNGIASAYVAWQLALAATKNLHAQDFEYADDDQRLSVLLEYLMFLAHHADRLTFEVLSNKERERFMHSFVEASCRHFQRNAEEILGAADYHGQFVKLLAERNSEYNICKAPNGQPGYGLFRSFGTHVQERMGNNQTNRWVIDQVIDIDAPEACSSLSKSINHLLETTDQRPH